MKPTLLLLLLAAGLVACPSRTPSNSSQTVSVARGKALYDTHCAACHGDQGQGNGPMANQLKPSPRDLMSGIFKYRATHGPIPSDTDLLQTMKMGIPGTSMPGWDLLTLNDWKSVLAYVKTLIPAMATQKPGAPIEIPAETPTTAASVQMGRELYAKRGCVGCHGAQGAGDGAAAAQLKDAWGDTVAPRDLTHGPLKWGNTPKDIYRTLAFGIPGTPMPAYEQTFTKDQLWALVHYIKSIQLPLPKDYNPSSPKRNLISVVRSTGAVPADPKDPAWDKVAAVPVFLKPLWAKPGMTEWLGVKALHDGNDVAFLIRWVDGGSNGAALQFPSDKVSEPADIPFLGMGNPKKPVTLWQLTPDGLIGFSATGPDHMTPISTTPPGATGKMASVPGERLALVKLPLSALGKGATPDTGYVSLSLWGAKAKSGARPDTFSEWMIYELK